MYIFKLNCKRYLQSMNGGTATDLAFTVNIYQLLLNTAVLCFIYYRSTPNFTQKV